MHTLDRKLLRDIWRLRGQVLAVALVVASGVALLIMSLSSLSSLRSTTDAYYDRYRFAEVFAGVKRAPEALSRKIVEIPGVQTVETRIVASTTVDVAGMAEPVVAQLVSLPAGRTPQLNQPAIREGRTLEAGHVSEAILLDPFARAHGLTVGDRISVLLNGVKREVRIVGLALSPEYVYAIGPGAMMPDNRRFGVIWMSRDALEAAYDLEGAFNNVTLALSRGADLQGVITRLDALLKRYGGTGAIARADQVSNWFLMNELKQLRSMATILPGCFLVAAVFLINTVLARLIDLERREISLLKAFGYGNLRIGVHYGELAVAMTLLGIAIGSVAGVFLGRYNTGVYAEIFNFPFLYYRPSPGDFLISAGISLAAALSGAIGAVRRAVVLPPAEAMRPPVPARFSRSVLSDGLVARLDQPTRIILRQVARTPLRSGLTVTGIAMAIGVLAMALHWYHSIDRLARSHFAGTLRQDITVGFFEPRAMAGQHAMERLPSVLAVEPMRLVRADFFTRGGSHRGSLTALQQGAALQVIDDARGFTMPVPAGGVVIGTELAKKLDAGIGDPVTIRVLEGAQPDLTLTVTGLNETYMDLPAYVDLAVLNRALGDPPVFQFANLLTDRAAEGALFAALKEMPGVASVMVKRSAEEKLYETLGETILIFTSIFVVFSSVLAVGMVYNATRIALSERGRELATMRVLGFGRAEISYILLGEAALLVLLALPLGCLIGLGLGQVMAKAFETELFRVPFVVAPSAYAWSILIVLAATAVSAALVRRRLDRLDLVAVLKTRE